MSLLIFRGTHPFRSERRLHSSSYDRCLPNILNRSLIKPPQMCSVNLALNITSHSALNPRNRWLTKNETGVAMSSCILHQCRGLSLTPATSAVRRQAQNHDTLRFWIPCYFPDMSPSHILDLPVYSTGPSSPFYYQGNSPTKALPHGKQKSGSGATQNKPNL